MRAKHAKAPQQNMVHYILFCTTILLHLLLWMVACYSWKTCSSPEKFEDAVEDQLQLLQNGRWLIQEATPKFILTATLISLATITYNWISGTNSIAITAFCLPATAITSYLIKPLHQKAQIALELWKQTMEENSLFHLQLDIEGGDGINLWISNHTPSQTQWQPVKIEISIQGFRISQEILQKTKALPRINEILQATNLLQNEGLQTQTRQKLLLAGATHPIDILHYDSLPSIKTFLENTLLRP